MVRKRLVATTHVRKLDNGDYPCGRLFERLLNSNYHGWVLLDSLSNPEDKLAAMKKQAEVFKSLLEAARSHVSSSAR